jgi:hypothetical protein
MQQSEVFKSGEATIKYLEKQLEACGKINIVCEKSAGEATIEIEEHFAKCVNALAARKEVLLKQIAQRVADQSRIFSCFTLFFFCFLFVGWSIILEMSYIVHIVGLMLIII